MIDDFRVLIRGFFSRFPRESRVKKLKQLWMERFLQIEMKN